MRFKLEKPVTEKEYGKTRTIAKFLWFPKEINYEIRWLERVLIEQKATYRLVSDPDEMYSDYRLPPVKQYYWEDTKWVDPPTNLM